MKLRSLITLSSLTATLLTTSAAEANPRKIVSEYSLALGREDALSTYLSPLNYSGFRPSLRGAWSKGMPFSPQTWRMRFDASLGGTRLMNSPKTAIEYSVSVDFFWGMERVFRVGDNWSFTAGGNVGFDASALWLTRNSNNPVSLPLWAGLSITGSAAFNLHFGRLPVTISERAAVRTLGAFFMPGYGESFYEIFIGNLKDIVHCGWWGNAPAVRSHLELTLHFRRTSLGIGYLLDYTDLRANNLRTRQVQNALTITLRK